MITEISILSYKKPQIKPKAFCLTKNLWFYLWFLDQKLTIYTYINTCFMDKWIYI